MRKGYRSVYIGTKQKGERKKKQEFVKANHPTNLIPY